MASRTRSTGGNIAFILAALSYLPFEIIAKSTLLFCIAIFVLDPFPTSRLVSVGGVTVVLLLTKMKKRFVGNETGAAYDNGKDKRE